MRVSTPPSTSLPESPFGRAVHFTVSSAYATCVKLLAATITISMAVSSKSTARHARDCAKFIMKP